MDRQRVQHPDHPAPIVLRGGGGRSVLILLLLFVVVFLLLLQRRLGSAVPVTVPAPVSLLLPPVLYVLLL